MELRNWITETFGSTDTLLDESVYSGDEIREDKIRLKQRRKQLNKDMSRLQREYRELLEEGADASDAERPQYAQRARMKKKKFKVKQQKFQKNSVQMATIVTIEGARELMEMSDEDELNLPDMNEVDYGEVQQHLREEMIQYEIETETMIEVQEALDIDIIGADMDMNGGEEEDIMKDMAAGQIDKEQVNIDDEEEDEADVGMDSTINGDVGIGPENLK
ncbi:hypothetical protein PM076_14880 [Halorubrum ezzemoulense]|uniref:hypothetical protein n=1 Tax=Halorubrum ezzemoulense TaxID=337243 RepID=UPI00232B642A|nr:hypothetical protein [Halorubrum ezzemoulense]MDB2245241.1 hypothetical protein [Halorubrum ezzemoulense]MDB2290097.1 hypothetical protein [Halorubrum ezzemoulense]MDB2297567.1 hypothetical protein [Halorubrum ezzemoulense]MDB2301147.1 hypothetical protein [Halorubrum ezzemoulense]